MLTIIWMACNQECMVENEKIVLIERLAFIERGTFCYISDYSVLILQKYFYAYN